MFSRLRRAALLTHNPDVRSVHEAFYAFQSGLIASIFNSPFSVTVRYIINMLLGTFQNLETSRSNLAGIIQRVNDGTVFTVRRVELSCFEAGKVSDLTLLNIPGHLEN